jgi:hypothetical protein
MLYRFLSVVVLVAAAGTAALGDAVSYVGRPVYEIIDEFRQAGYPFAYSNALVSDELLVIVEPDSGEPAEIVRQILAPHRLTVRYEAGVYLVIRVAPPEKTAEPVMQVEKPAIESITVSASRYEIGRDVATSRFLIDRRTIQTMPDVGEDPLRAVLSKYLQRNRFSRDRRRGSIYRRLSRALRRSHEWLRIDGIDGG